MGSVAAQLPLERQIGLWVDRDGTTDRRQRRLRHECHDHRATAAGPGDDRIEIGLGAGRALDQLAQLLDVADEIDAIGLRCHLGEGLAQVDADHQRASGGELRARSAHRSACTRPRRRTGTRCLSAGWCGCTRSATAKVSVSGSGSGRIQYTVKAVAAEDCRQAEAKPQGPHLEIAPRIPPPIRTVTSAIASNGLRPPATAM